MVLQVERRIAPEVKKYNVVIAAQQEKCRECVQGAQEAQKAAAGKTVVVQK